MKSGQTGFQNQISNNYAMAPNSEAFEFEISSFLASTKSDTKSNIVPDGATVSAGKMLTSVGWQLTLFDPTHAL